MDRAVAARRLGRLPAAAGAVVGDLHAGQRRARGVDDGHRRRHRGGVGDAWAAGQRPAAARSAHAAARTARPGRPRCVGSRGETDRTNELTRGSSARRACSLSTNDVCNRAACGGRSRIARVPPIPGTWMARCCRRCRTRKSWTGAGRRSPAGGRTRRTLIVFGVLALLAVGAFAVVKRSADHAGSPPSARARPTRPSARSARSWPARRAPTCAASSASFDRPHHRRLRQVRGARPREPGARRRCGRRGDRADALGLRERARLHDLRAGRGRRPHRRRARDVLPDAPSSRRRRRTPRSASTWPPTRSSPTPSRPRSRAARDVSPRRPATAPAAPCCWSSPRSSAARR